MPELESVIEKKLIDQLCYDKSQWTLRDDIRNEDDLWRNFKYILEQNNKRELDGTPLTENEFEKIKNDVSHTSFYEAGKWLVGENGKVYVHIQRGNELLHLVVFNNEHIAGGTSVYEVIHQYNAFKDPTDDDDRNRRFDITLLINGLPMIHIELKNKNHSYLEGFRQIRKYIAEGKFHGAFSNVQMFVVSNEADTKYFAASKELNDNFISSWLDENNKAICNYLDFTKAILRIPQAHEMVTKYTVLDKDKGELILLRPYQIHAIEAMRAASKIGKSGYIWHTTGSGKTLTSYKATRNLLMDIPALDKTIFLIDRKDLDKKTKDDFQSYAVNDTIDVDDTEHVGNLIKNLTNSKRQMIVTTRHKLQIMINKRLQEGSRNYEKIKSLKIAFVVDECHRAISPMAKRELEDFFSNSLWYGFTGTPRFDANPYEKMGDLPRTTDTLYGGNGKPLHSYTIKEAIHDNAVLGFMTEHLGSADASIIMHPEVYEKDAHIRAVLNTILNKSYEKFGFRNGKGRTYEAILSASSIPMAIKYYNFLKKIIAGNDELKIDEKIKIALPDFPKFSITYSLSENEEHSTEYQNEMKTVLKDYNALFGTHYTIENIDAFNANLSDRLVRKDKKYRKREQQLDFVIVVDRLLTGFDAPCLSTLFMDRDVMPPHDLIQSFSRTNRLFDDQKQYGYIVTFQNPEEYKVKVDEAIKLYSRGGTGLPVAEDWDVVYASLTDSINNIRNLARTPEDISRLSNKEKKHYIKLFRALDHDLAHLKAFSKFDESVLSQFSFTNNEYEDYMAMYNNIMDELKSKDSDDDVDDDLVLDDYKLIAYSKQTIDFEYIVGLLQGVMDSYNSPDKEYDAEAFDSEMQNLREMISTFSETNPKLSSLLNNILDEIEADRSKFIGKDISKELNDRRNEMIDAEIKKYAVSWFLNVDDVRYEVYCYRDGEMANETKLKESADYAAYKNSMEEPLSKFKFYSEMIRDFKNNLIPEVVPLLP